MSGAIPSVEQVIAEIASWSESDKGKEHIKQAYFLLQDASVKLREEANINPDKLKIVIGI